nr:hypothetical protein [Tanacetum cinerariifolium]
MSGHQETSLDSEYEEDSEDTYEPYKRPKPTLFTQRITHFKYHQRAKLPRNIKAKKMQDFADRFLKRNVSPSGNSRPSSNHGKGRREQNGANGVCYNKMSFVVQRHNRKDQNEKPRSENLCGNVDSWKGCKVHERRVEEGRFLGHMVTNEGVRADLEKVQTIIRSPTPKSPNQIRSLFLQLTAISKFIPKLTELKYPIREVQIKFETAEGPSWTNEAKEALRRIKRKLNKLKTLGIPKEGEVLMLCLRQRSETETPDANKGETYNQGKKLQAKSTPTPRAWRLYLGKETIEEGLAGSVSKGMKDLHFFIDSLTLVAQIEGNHTSTMEQEMKYKEEIINATALFYKFRITHLPKILNSKTEVLTGLATIKLEFLNQEGSIGIKTRPSVEKTSSSKKEKAASNVPGTKPNYD